MDWDRATLLTQKIAAFYPGRTIEEAHMAVWMDELRPLDEEVAVRVVARVRMTLPDPPSAARLREIVRVVKGDYDFGNQGTRALPSHEMTPEERERSRQFFVKVREEMYARHPEWKRHTSGSMFNETPEEREERTRAYARNPDDEPELVKLRIAGERQYVGGCGGAGKYVAVTKDGKRVCPDCGVEIEDQVVCVPVKRKGLA